MHCRVHICKFGSREEFEEGGKHIKSELEVGDSRCCMKAELKRNGIGKWKCLLGTSEAYEKLFHFFYKHFSKSTLLSVCMLEGAGWGSIEKGEHRVGK